MVRAAGLDEQPVAQAVDVRDDQRVDFPLARPTELAWWWVAIALALQATPPIGRAIEPAGSRLHDA